MFQRLIFSVLVLLIGLSAFSQNDLNDYKYVVVPLQFDFVKGKDKYRVNSLTRHLFNSNGFKAVFDEEELPKDLFNNRCLAMYADVVKASGVFSTKLQIELKDCYGNQIFLSSIGKTKEKDLKKAYPIAIRKAFESVKFLDYKYNPNSEGALKNKQQSTVVSKVENVDTDAEAEKATAEVERLKKEVEELKQQKALEKAKQEAEAKAQVELKRKTEEEKNKLENEQRKRLELEKSKSITDSDLLYAQPTDKGFQLVDITPKVVMVILKTAAPNVFTVKGKNAIIFKEGDTWFYSENDTKKPLNIKF